MSNETSNESNETFAHAIERVNTEKLICYYRSNLLAAIKGSRTRGSQHVQLQSPIHHLQDEKVWYHRGNLLAAIQEGIQLSRTRGKRRDRALHQTPITIPLPLQDSIQEVIQHKRLLSACETGDLNTVLKVLPLTNPNFRKFGRTPLFSASANGRLQIVQCLCESDADLNVLDSRGRTPLMVSSDYGYLDVVKTLCNHGADVNKAPIDGNPPLILASRNGHLPIVYLLCTQGADLNRTDNNGRSAIILATVNGHTEIVHYLNREHNWQRRRSYAFLLWSVMKERPSMCPFMKVLQSIDTNRLIGSYI